MFARLHMFIIALVRTLPTQPISTHSAHLGARVRPHRNNLSLICAILFGNLANFQEVLLLCY